MQEETKKHISRVQYYTTKFIQKLIEDSLKHDKSKLAEPEVSIFTKVTPKLKYLTYGSEEYNKQLKELGVALKHHYENNTHHPEHWDRGIEGMSLINIVEMFCDWMAAVERHADGDINKSIEVNEKRFKIPKELSNIFRNTVYYLK